MMMATAQLRASTVKRNYGYSAAVRDVRGKVIAQCVHDHQNRDDNRWLSPTLSYKDFPNMLSAFNCAKLLLKDCLAGNN